MTDEKEKNDIETGTSTEFESDAQSAAGSPTAQSAARECRGRSDCLPRAGTLHDSFEHGSDDCGPSPDGLNRDWCFRAAPDTGRAGSLPVPSGHLRSTRSQCSAGDP